MPRGNAYMEEVHEPTFRVFRTGDSWIICTEAASFAAKSDTAEVQLYGPVSEPENKRRYRCLLKSLFTFDVCELDTNGDGG